MRNADRLDEFYEAVKKIHKEYFPDWRFGQLFENLRRQYGDLFYKEEVDIVQLLADYVERSFVTDVVFDCINKKEEKHGTD